MAVNTNIEAARGLPQAAKRPRGFHPWEPRRIVATEQLRPRPRHRRRLQPNAKCRASLR